MEKALDNTLNKEWEKMKEQVRVEWTKQQSWGVRTDRRTAHVGRSVSVTEAGKAEEVRPCKISLGQ